MEELGRRLLKLIWLRWILVCTVVVSTAFVLPKDPSWLEFSKAFFLVVTVLSAVYLLLWKYLPSHDALYHIQFYTDLVLLSSLVYFSGGINSLFVPFYVLIIVYASLLRGRMGGLLALVFSLLSYLALVQLGYLGMIPGSEGADAFRNEVYRISINLMAFVSVAFLGIYLSERLSSAHRELGVARVVQENIIDSLRSGLLTLDLEGRISFCNRVGANILNAERENQVGRLLSEVFPAQVLEAILSNDFHSTQRALRLESWSSTENGESVYLGFGCSPLLSQEQSLIGYIVSFQDLTDIKRREDEFQFKEKMAAIGEMAAGLAHELRNPLGSLSGSIQILKSELQLSPDQSRLLEIVLRESERLNRTVGNFLEYAGPHETVRQAIDLNTLVQETAQLFRNSPEFKKGSHELRVSTPAEEALCRGNADQLRQVLWNILQNGIRAMPRGGMLEIRVSREPGRVALGVSDTGIGMSEKEREKLFQPFHSGFRKGTGLGMAIVYQIVRQHGGEIQVRSAVGQGTEIEVRLPTPTVAPLDETPMERERSKPHPSQV